MKNVALVFGGEGSEHDISKISASFIEQNLRKSPHNIEVFELDKHFSFIQGNKKFTLYPDKVLRCEGINFKIDYLIPCIHGYPGETGDFQSILSAYNINYLGCDSESSKVCFNKTLTKLMLEHLGINTTPFLVVTSDNFEKQISFLKQHKEIFVKATNQGSSIGCYKVQDEKDLKSKIEEAFKLSKHVIIEKSLKPRELEVAVFEYQGQVHISHPSEVTYSGTFYDYSEKYSGKSSAQTNLKPDLSKKVIQNIKEITRVIFSELKLKDLSRVDFFLVDDQIFVNEVNTFPGMTSISLFPKMMQDYGVSFESYIQERIDV